MTNSKQTSLMDKIKCALGWHAWSWIWVEGEPLDGTIQDRANCIKCGINFKTGEKPNV